MEELQRSQPSRNRAARGIVETEDSCEHGMRVPTSVLDGCNESFTAADEKRQKVCLKLSMCQFFDSHVFRQAPVSSLTLVSWHFYVVMIVSFT